MRLFYSQLPGRHERHLLRMQDNPLFPKRQRTVTQNELTEAQRLDHEELESYIRDLRKLVGEAVALGPHEQSDVILELKERLDQAYETACRLADDQTPNKEAIRKLVEVIMRAVWKGAGNDTLAHQELEQEDSARATHYELLEQPLVADLLDPKSLIQADELLPVLLTAKREEFEAAITLFDSDQLQRLCEQGVELRRNSQALNELPQARERLLELEKLLSVTGGHN
jgi:hypothetical protein